MKYFFILGNNPALSEAEIQSLFPNNKTGRIFAGNVFVLESDEFNAKALIGRMGGTIKIGVILSSTLGRDLEKIKKEAAGIIDGLRTENEELRAGKFKFGFSYYGRKKLNLKPVGMEIKNFLKEKNISCRWVISREDTLSSVVVEQNKLIGKGIEIILIEDGENILIGYTEAVQPFKELSKRDYGRPSRDDQSGMIPPKLAQIMINLSGKNSDATHPVPPLASSGTPLLIEGISLLDPFCGSGTILMEAALQGIANLIGSDISEKAIQDTEENMKWLKTNYKLQITNYELFNISATELSEKISPTSVDAIITEPYLGPQRGWHDIKKTVKELEELYSEALKEFKKILKPGGAIVMIFPIFISPDGQKKDFLNINLSGFQLIRPRKSLIYGREGQKVHREIIILKK